MHETTRPIALGVALLLGVLLLQPSAADGQATSQAPPDPAPTPLPTVTASGRLPLPLAETRDRGPWLVPITISTNVMCVDREARIVRNNAEWAALLAQWAGGTASPLNSPTIDFDHNMVIGVCMGTPFSGGYTISITTIEETDDALLVYVQEHEPESGCLRTAHQDSPYSLVVLRQTERAVQFIVRRTMHYCPLS